MLEIVLVLNTLWFFGGFNLFYLRREAFARWLVPKNERDNKAFEALIATGRFMGGFNFALMLLSLLLLINMSEFDTNRQWAILLMGLAAAHGWFRDGWPRSRTERICLRMERNRDTGRRGA